MNSQRAFPFFQAPERAGYESAGTKGKDRTAQAPAPGAMEHSVIDLAVSDADAHGPQAHDSADSGGLDFDEVPFVLSEEERGLRSPEEMGFRARQLAEDFSAILGSPIRLTVTDNRSSMFSFRAPRGEVMSVRLHHMFLDAPPSKRILLFLQFLQALFFQ